MDDVIRTFAPALLEDMKKIVTDLNGYVGHGGMGMGSGWDHMMTYDRYSVRAYMSTDYRPSEALRERFQLPNTAIPADVINWYETRITSTGMFDRSLTDYVLEAIAFGWQPVKDRKNKTEWFCIAGGAEQIAKALYKYLSEKRPDAFLFNQRVTGIRTKSDPEGEGMEVTINNSEKVDFPYVISTIPLPVLRTIDLSGANLSPIQLSSLRQLTYGSSTKIGMQFCTAWWTKKLASPIVGGQTFTDSPLRTVVYPSFGDVENGKTTTLIASYCWTDDAERLAALISHDNETLTRLALRELSRIHGLDEQFLRDDLIDIFAWDWSQDIFTMGAFANFEPGKFGNLFKSMTLPAGNGRLFFAGEALSTKHAWIEGALESACHAVSAFVTISNVTTMDCLLEFLKELGIDDQWGIQPPPTPGGVFIPPVLGPRPPKGSEPVAEEEEEEEEEDSASNNGLISKPMFICRMDAKPIFKLKSQSPQDELQSIVRQDPYLRYLAANGY